MIQEFIKEYRLLEKDYNLNHDESPYWFIDRINDLVEKYDKNIIAQELKAMYSKPFDPAVNDSIKDMEEEERAFPSDKE